MNSFHTAVGELPVEEIRAADQEIVPCLVHACGAKSGSVVSLRDRPMIAGRMSNCDIVLEGATVSRNHCEIIPGARGVDVRDLGSTNGTFVNNREIRDVVALGADDLIRVGTHVLRVAMRTRVDIQAAEAQERDLERAARYVNANLPSRIERGAVIVDWESAPCAKLGGDIFGYQQCDGGFTAYLLEVSGQGVGAAMHSTAIQSLLAQGELPGVDMREPAQVLGYLNNRFPMNDHQGLCFTIWYGHYDIRSRRLIYGSGGHHPALLVSPDRKHLVPLQTKNPMLGALPGQRYSAEVIDIPPSWSIYLFSDGAFDITDRSGRQWALSDIENLIRVPGPVGPGEPQRMLRAICEASETSPLLDDCSILTMTFV